MRSWRSLAGQSGRCVQARPEVCWDASQFLPIFVCCECLQQQPACRQRLLCLRLVETCARREVAQGEGNLNHDLSCKPFSPAPTHSIVQPLEGTAFFFQILVDVVTDLLMCILQNTQFAIHGFQFMQRHLIEE